MGKNLDKRSGHVVVRSEAPYTPGADGYNEQGDMIFKNKARAREWAAQTNEEQGRRIVVDPDGGIPHGEEDRRMHERERSEHAERVANMDSRRREEFIRRIRARGGQV